MRRICILAVAAALVACLAAAPPAGAKCQRLKGADLAPARSVKLVERPNHDDGTDLVGCVLPRGRVRTIASSSDQYTTGTGFAIRQIAGERVLLDSSYNSQYAYWKSTYVADVHNGRTYGVAYQCFDIGNSDCSSGGSTSAPAAFVTKLGRAVAAISPVTGAPGPAGPTTITAFDPLGRHHDLDTGPTADLPSASLQLVGLTAYWTHAGAPRLADIRSAG